jgi:hypothetical protein
VFTSRRPMGGASTWHAHRVAATLGFGTLTCASAGFCMALVPGEGGGDAIFSRHPGGGASAWRDLSIPTGGINSLTSISCPSPLLCVASDDAGRVVTSTSPAGALHTWTSRTIKVHRAISAVSCPSTSFCAALVGAGSLGGAVLTSHRPAGPSRDWAVASSPARTGGGLSLSGLSCPTSSLCVAFSGDQILTSSNPAGGAGTWTVQYTDPAPVQCVYHGGCTGQISGLTCPAATVCVAIDNSGDVLGSTDPAGGASGWSTTHLPYGLGGISCSSASFCVIGAGDNVLTSNSPASGTWAATPVPQGAPSIFPESCPTTRLCVGANASHLVLSTNPAGGRWITADADRGITGVSCPSASLCVAIDGHGRAIVGTSSSR